MDPKIALMELLRTNWAVDFIPKFSTDWYDAEEEMPQVIVSHVLTALRTIGFSSDLGSSQRRIAATYAVDVWSRGDQEKRWRMLNEVDRIVHSKCSSPGSGLEFVEPSSWRDLDEVDTYPKLYRSQVRVEVLYYG